MHKDKILIVEDDEITSLNLNISLQKQGYTIVAVCDNIEQAKTKLATVNPDLVIIDIPLDERDDGVELAQYITKKYQLPFIYLTSYSNDEIIEKAKLTEPYGYIIKPFDIKLLHATIQIALYRFSQEKIYKNSLKSLKTDKKNLENILYAKKVTDTPIVPFGEKYHLDINLHETFYQDKKIRLTKKENAFLHLLVTQLGSIISFNQAREYVWSEHGATENSVRTLVWRLRSKLPSDIIKNASGVGYYIEE